MSHTKQIFGYGSLINSGSLLLTAPSASNIRPCYIKGFRRSFSVWCARGVHKGSYRPDLGLIGIPICALDIEKADDSDTKVNGVTFTVSEEDATALTERENEYKAIETVAYDFVNDEKLGNCLVFMAGKLNGEFAFETSAQRKYLKVCLEGAEHYGDAFYQMFLDTTYIGDKKLRDLPKLRKELAA